MPWPWRRKRLAGRPEASPAPQKPASAAPVAAAPLAAPPKAPEPPKPERDYAAAAEALLANRAFRDTDPALHREGGTALRNYYKEKAYDPILRDWVVRAEIRWGKKSA